VFFSMAARTRTGEAASSPARSIPLVDDGPFKTCRPRKLRWNSANSKDKIIVAPKPRPLIIHPSSLSSHTEGEATGEWQGYSQRLRAANKAKEDARNQKRQRRKCFNVACSKDDIIAKHNKQVVALQNQVEQLKMAAIRRREEAQHTAGEYEQKIHSLRVEVEEKVAQLQCHRVTIQDLECKYDRVRAHQDEELQRAFETGIEHARKDFQPSPSPRVASTAPKVESAYSGPQINIDELFAKQSAQMAAMHATFEAEMDRRTRQNDSRGRGRGRKKKR